MPTPGRTSLALAFCVALLPLAAVAQDAAPKVDHQAITRAAQGERLVLRARIVSLSGLPVVEPAAFVRLPGVTGFSRLAMRADAAFKDLFVAEIPAAYVAGDLDYYLEAFDADGNGPGRAGSPEAPFHIAVAAPPVATAPPPAAVLAAELAYLRVITTPVGATVSIDGTRAGASPHLGPVHAGIPHRVLVEADGFRPFETTTPSLAAGTEGRIELELEPRPSNLLVAASFILFQPGLFNGDQDYGFSESSSSFGQTPDHFAVHSSRGVNLSLTWVLADHHGIALDATWSALELQTDVSGYEGKSVAKGRAYGSYLGYRALFGPFSVFRPRLGLLAGARAIAIGEGDSGLGFRGEQSTQVQPVADVELGFALELPGHVSLDVSGRVGVLSFFRGLPVNTLGAGLGGHF